MHASKWFFLPSDLNPIRLTFGRCTRGHLFLQRIRIDFNATSPITCYKINGSIDIKPSAKVNAFDSLVNINVITSLWHDMIYIPGEMYLNELLFVKLNYAYTLSNWLRIPDSGSSWLQFDCGQMWWISERWSEHLARANQRFGPNFASLELKGKKQLLYDSHRY